MENKLAKVLSYIFYAIAIILVILFAVIVIVGYYDYKELLLNPLIDIIPFSSLVKIFAVRLLVPAILCAVSGYVIQRINIKKQ
ncbi:MAG: hypothetical protein IJC10_02945 [Clostridia bacterium]|nr:hypothetical protein [Clostridia bacterium]